MVSILNSTGTTPVLSVLDQRKRDGPIYVDFLPVSSGNFSSPKTLFHASTGYVFYPSSPSIYPTTTTPQLSISTGKRTGNWSAIGISKQPPTTTDLFTAWLSHPPMHHDGENYSTHSAGGGVEYTVFPGRASREEFYADAFGAGLETLYADTRVYAVQDRVRGTVMSVFWESSGGVVHVPPGGGEGGSGVGGEGIMLGVDVASDSALVMVLDRGTWRVDVADPTQVLEGAWLVFDVRRNWPVGLPRGWGPSGRKSVRVVFPRGARAGSSVVLSLVEG